jgi:hypothetical protein
VGDTAKKLLHLNTPLSESLKIPITQHDKLPDIVLYDLHKELLFLIEVVTIHGPLSPKRQIELEELLKRSKAGRIYISAFPDFRRGAPCGCPLRSTSMTLPGIPKYG